MSCVEVWICDISAYFSMPRSTVYNIIRRNRKLSTKVILKSGPKRKLSDGIKRLFQRTAPNHCLPYLHCSRNQVL